MIRGKAKVGVGDEIEKLSERLKKSKLSLDEALKKDAETETKEAKTLAFFHENTNRNLAEHRLKEAGNSSGIFLVRDSAGTAGDYVLSLVHEKKPKHYQINQKGSNKFRIGTGTECKGLDGLINHYYHNAGGLACELIKPCSRSLPPSFSRAQGYTNLLHTAIAEGSTDLAINILSSKYCPNINEKNSKGSTALHDACSQGLYSVVEKLLSKGALVVITDADGHTPLQRACMNNQHTVTELLVVKGHADPQDRHPETGGVALHEAAKAGHLECVKKLLSLNAAAWPRDKDRMAPAELAAASNKHECVKYLNSHKPAPAKAKQSDWFHQTLDRNGALSLLEKHHLNDGLFLVRKSSRSKTAYVLVMTYDMHPYNFEIQAMGSTAYFIDESPLMPSLEHMIEYFCIRADGLPCKLTAAISPNGTVKNMSVNFLPNEAAQPGSSNQLSLPQPAAPIKSPARRRKGITLLPAPKPPQVNEPMRLDPRSIKLGHELGQGEYGSVLIGRWTDPKDGKKHDVAIKTLHNEYMATSRDNFLREAEVMVKVNHPCIVQLIGVCQGPPIMLVQELMPLGSLLDFLLDYPERVNPDQDLILWAAQVAYGMSYLQEKQYVHRDLAARNILLASKKQAKIADFGLSRAVEGGSNYYKASVGGRWPIKWYAPECMNYGQFSSQSDVWSFGVTVWEMYSFGDQPYGTMIGAQVCQFIEKGGRLKLPRKCPEAVYRKMRQCWEYKSANRPSFKDLYDFFRGRKDPNYPLVPDQLMNAMGLSVSSTHV